MKHNWQAINDKFKGGFLLVGLVECTTNGFFDEDKIKDIKEFFTSHPCSSVDRTIKQSCERIKLQSDWLKRDGDAIGTWTQNRK